MFVDRISNLLLKAGRGGDGRKSTSALKKADGGDGGKGGDVYLVGNSNYYDLSHLTSHREYSAKNGEMGGKKQCHGENGQDLELQVPLITSVYNTDGVKVCSVSQPGQKVKLLEGGLGGMGNYFFRTKFMGYERTSLGRDGEEEYFKLELELHSDVIFIGFPNAGKSTIINELSNADAKIGAYAFTTINPQQGRMGDITLLDLPGLIEQTHKGKGLGTKFAKHTRNAKILAHMISFENDSVVDAYQKMRDELKQIGEGLVDKHEVIVLTKSDVVDESKKNEVVKEMKKLKKDVIAVTALSEADMKSLEEFFRENLNGLITRSEQSAEEAE